MPHTWQPTDNQVVQLLLNRGHLTREQVRFAVLRQQLGHSPSLLQLLDDADQIDQSLVRRVVQEARQDHLVRQRLQDLGVLTSRQIAEATAKQRGTPRTLAQTLQDEGFCSRETVRMLLTEGATPAAARGGMPGE
ncbi:hypothetical protein D3C72_918390 [compost metagenome]